MKTTKRYKSAKLVIVGYDFHSEGGAWRSIYRYFRFCEAIGEDVMLIDRRKQRTLRRLACAFLFSPKILFNGIESFSRWEAIAACLLRKDILVYLHDTESSIRAFYQSSPIKYRFFRLILRRNTILVVSKQMEEYYRRDLGVQRCQVVREAVVLPEVPEFDPTYRHIVMVGSVEERKGVALYSEVARLALEKGLKWKFHWVGALASQSLGVLSEDIRWWGWQDSPTDFIKKTDVFFLSSVDDPLPLACLEAISLGKRCLVYRGTGISELLDGVGGCAVMEHYTPEEALMQLGAILNQEPDSQRLLEIATQEGSLPAFAEKVNQVLNPDTRLP
ncbi:MAG: glycosyltransferase [Chthoniobacterales bacterium]